MTSAAASENPDDVGSENLTTPRNVAQPRRLYHGCSVVVARFLNHVASADADA